MPEFLLEVGFEEMPAPWLKALATELSSKFGDAGQREFLDPRATQSWWTPRRLVLSAQVLARQADRDEPVWGPSLKAAKDASGAWTAAAQGFAKKSGVGVEALQHGAKDPSKPNEAYLLFVRKTAGRAATEVLPGVIAASLRGLNFPKRMNWDAWLDDGKGAFPFGRPIRWLVAMLDGTVIPFVIYEQVDGAKGKARVASGPATIGHRFLPRGAGGRFTIVRSLADLQEGLRASFVLLDPAERAARIDEGLQKLGGMPEDDHGLREEWRDLVEYPTVVSGTIPAEFHELPREVLETVLVHHQKYVPLATADGTVSRFAAITNGEGSAAAEVVRGMERVVVARLRDASFFYAEDRKRRLADRVADLAGVTFHQGLGSYKDKADRLVRLVTKMNELALLREEDAAAAVQAAQLAKTDLTTLMVREFAELQGTMGGLYLAAEGVPEAVAKAVRWHYHPISIEEGSSPAEAFATSGARVFAAVSLADKVDTLAGYFLLGENPTGSRDPLGLRRAAQGAIRVILDFWRPQRDEESPSLSGLVKEALDGYAVVVDRPLEKVVGTLELFLLERLQHVLVSRGFPVDEVAAVLHTSPNAGAYALDDPLDCLVRLRALHRVRAEHKEDFAQLAIAFRRARNILEKEPGVGFFDEHRLIDDAERALYQAIEKSRGTWSNENGRFTEAEYENRLRSVGSLAVPVDRFFEDVLVLAEDEALKRNRLGLMDYLISPIYRIADISKLGGQS